MSNRPNHVLGKYGELVAAEYLVRQGYEIVDRNWHCQQGELDLVAKAGLTLGEAQMALASLQLDSLAEGSYEGWRKRGSNL